MGSWWGAQKWTNGFTTKIQVLACRIILRCKYPEHNQPGSWHISQNTSQWRHNGRDSVSNHQPHDCLLNRLFRRRSKKTSKLRVTGLCVGNSPLTSESRHKWPVTRRMFPFDDVIMILNSAPKVLFLHFGSSIFTNEEWTNDCYIFQTSTFNLSFYMTGRLCSYSWTYLSWYNMMVQHDATQQYILEYRSYCLYWFEVSASVISSPRHICLNLPLERLIVVSHWNRWYILL